MGVCWSDEPVSQPIQQNPLYTPPPILLYLKLLNGDTIPVWASPLDTVGELKLRIKQLLYISPIQQILVVQGAHLEDHQVLSQIGLHSGSLLFLVIRLL